MAMLRKYQYRESRTRICRPRRCSTLHLLGLMLFACIVCQTTVTLIVSFSLTANGRQFLRELGMDRISTTNEGNRFENKNSKRLLVIATAPRDERHIWTLWSELECFAKNVDHVILSAPLWSENITNKIMQEVEISIPRFVEGKASIEVQFHVNDRYDVGLWCDALKSRSKHWADFDEFGLLNDSVFALREYSTVFDSLKERNISLSSLSYSYSPKNFRGGRGKEHFWVESVFRGLTSKGLQIFMNHSCLPANHRSFCRGRPINEQKACIINNFEHDLASHFPEGDVEGLFESDAPPETKVRPYKGRMSWANNPLYWRKLVEESNFPVAKENIKESVRDLDNPLLENCTKFLTRDRVKMWNLNFSVREYSLKDNL